MTERAERREKRRLIDARFPQIKRLEDFHFSDNPKIPQATIAAFLTACNTFSVYACICRRRAAPGICCKELSSFEQLGIDLRVLAGQNRIPAVVGSLGEPAALCA